MASWKLLRERLTSAEALLRRCEKVRTHCGWCGRYVMPSLGYDHTADCLIHELRAFLAEPLPQEAPPEGPVTQASPDTRQRIAEMTAKWPVAEPAGQATTKTRPMSDARRQRVLSVSCPGCKVPAGSACVEPVGLAYGFHISRLRAGRPLHPAPAAPAVPPTPPAPCNLCDDTKTTEQCVCMHLKTEHRRGGKCANSLRCLCRGFEIRAAAPCPRCFVPAPSATPTTCPRCHGAREVVEDDAGMLARPYMRPCPTCSGGTSHPGTGR